MGQIILLGTTFKLLPKGNCLTIFQLEQYVFCRTITYLRSLAFKVGVLKIFLRTGSRLHSPLSLENKILIYKTILKQVWTYGIELWGCASNSNIEIIQRYQSKLLRSITNAPWYVTNHTLHSELHIPYVREVFLVRIANHRTSIAKHPNPLMAPLLRSLTTRRLKRRWTFDELH